MNFEVHLQNFSQVSTRKGYGGTIYLRITKVIILHLLRIYNFTKGYVLITDNLVSLKKENMDIILIVKIIEWRKLIDYFGLSIEANPSRVVKNNVYIYHIWYIPRPSYRNTHIARHHMDK